MALAFTEGSIGGDIERIPLPELADFYDVPRFALRDEPAAPASRGPTGSNGIAIAPSNTTDHHAPLLINPHTSFYFRSELQMASDAGLDTYGAVTWGQFFVYQGSNERVGWMHTSSYSDAVDQFLETIVHKDGGLFYRYGNLLRPVAASKITVSYRTQTGGVASRSFTIYKTGHGPIVGKAVDGRWVSEAMMFKPLAALEQSYALTKARDYRSYLKVMELKATSSYLAPAE